MKVFKCILPSLWLFFILFVSCKTKTTKTGDTSNQPQTPSTIFKIIEIDGVKFNMATIPPLENPTKLCGQENVTLDAYQLAQTEVTQALYKKVMGSIPANQPDFATGISEDDKPYCPVAKISWYNAVAFCNELTIKAMSDADCVYYADENKTKVYRKADGEANKYPYVDWSKKGFRLPTEVEWEAAALARENHKYPGSDTLKDVGWYDENNSQVRTILHKVATKAPNKFALYDMAGNVAEWVWDPYVASDNRQTHPVNKNPTYRHQKTSNNSCGGAGTIRGGEYYNDGTTDQYKCTARDEAICKQAYDSVSGVATGIRLSRGGISVFYEKVNVKIMLGNYEMRKEEVRKADSKEGFEKEFFPFTDKIEIKVEAEDGANVICSKNSIDLNETFQEVIITATKEGKGKRECKLRLKKGGKIDKDATNSEKTTYRVGNTGVKIDMISLASVHDIWLGNIDKPNNQPHKVSLSKYQISSTEITQKVYYAVTGTNPSFFKERYKVPADVQELRPVESVYWYEAVAFCNLLTEKVSGNTNDCVYYDDANFTTVYTMDHAKRDITTINKQTGAIPQTPYVKWENKGFRLPTEAEWEWASYGGEYGRYAGNNNLDNVAWYGENATQILDQPAVTRQVATKEANGYGLYDMTGNVYEWCGEWWSATTPEGGQDPKGPQTSKHKYKVTRSSSYGLSILNKPRHEDVSRDYTRIYESFKYCGIRVVCKLF